MNTANHNLIVASNLVRASAFINAATYFIVEPRPGIIIEFLTLAFTILIARLIRKGYKWTRWVLLSLSIISVPLYIIGLFMLKTNMLLQLPNIAISLVETVAVIYLFLPYRELDYEES